MIQAKAHEAGLEFLLIGGHAVNLYAEPRATLDVDLLIRNVQAIQWNAILALEGYTAYHDGGNFLQFRPPYGTNWRLDLMLVNDETFAKLLAASEPVECFGVPMRIPSAEHMIALKLHSIVHGPADRFEKDFVDVVGIARNTGLDPNSSNIKEIFHRFGTTEIYEKFKSRLQSQ
jgi:hypothetical protein